MINVFNPKVSKIEKYFVILLITLLTLVFILTYTFNQNDWQKSPALIAVCGSLISLASFQTAFLLYNQSKINQNSSVAILSSGYLLIGLFSLVRTIFIPGTFMEAPQLNENSQISAYIWTIWHVVFPLYIIFYALTNSRKIDLSYTLTQWNFRSSFIIGILFSIFIVFYDESLPSIISKDSYYRTIYLDILISCLTGISIYTLCSLNGIEHRQDLWLLLAICVHGFDILFGIAGGARYTVGWYFAMLNSIISSSIILGVFIHHLTTVVKKIADKNIILADLSEHDELTKIPNRRKFNNIFKTLWELSLQQSKHLSLVLVDIDKFKDYNDTFGHLKGDECLIKISNILQNVPKRESDLVFRIGGEEFAILLYGMNKNAVLKFSEVLRQEVENNKIATHSSQNPFITISIGCSSIIPDGTITEKQFIDLVDQALYKSKHDGRNKVTYAEQNTP